MTGRNGSASLLARHIARSGAANALVCLNATGEIQSLSWQGVADRVASLVAAIDRQGFRPGDRLVHSLGNTGDGVAMAISSLIAGTIEVPLPPADCAEATGHASHDSLCRLVDGEPFDASACKDAKGTLPLSALLEREQCHGDDRPALILFTSGSTGAPRGVTLSRRNLFSNARGKLAAVPQQTSDVRLTVLPIWHAYARTCDLMTWLLSGCSLGIAFGWKGWQQLAPSVQPTLVNTVPSLANRLLNEAACAVSASRLRAVGCGGAAMPADSFARFSELGIPVIQGYGLTEASPVICSASPANARADRVGLPIPGCETRLGADGRLSIRGEGVMLGYWNDPVATGQKIRDAWLDTGDCVEVDSSDGQFRVLGRADDRITLSNGLKFFPGPIEKCAASLPGIRHALLIARGRRVDLFIDVDSSVGANAVETVRRAIGIFPHWQRPREIFATPRSFAKIPGATTAKGTLCRPVATAACLRMRSEGVGD